MRFMTGPTVLAVLLAAVGPARAQEAASPASAQEEQESLRVYFDTASDRVQPDQEALLDQAARLFREGSPIVMIVAGGADTVGASAANLQLSIRRAQAVADGLVARGIPADRLQVLGRGTSELAVETPDGTESRENRVVEITWR